MTAQPALASSKPRSPSSGPLSPALASSLGVLSIPPREPGNQEGEGRERQPVTPSLWPRDGVTVPSGLCTPARPWPLWSSGCCYPRGEPRAGPRTVPPLRGATASGLWWRLLSLGVAPGVGTVSRAEAHSSRGCLTSHCGDTPRFVNSSSVAGHSGRTHRILNSVRRGQPRAEPFSWAVKEAFPILSGWRWPRDARQAQCVLGSESRFTLPAA